MQKLKFEPNKCECCGLTTNYLLAIDKGTIEILKAVSRAIGDKGINIVHANKELIEKGYLTPLQRGNMSRPRAHGLIAMVKGDGMKGNYLLTSKGAKFLRGEIRIPKYAIMNKVTSHQAGYFEAEEHTVGVNDYMEGEYWEGIGYDIQQGRVVKDLKEGSTAPIFT